MGRKSKKIKFITGGCGFVGRHLCKNILADGDEVWVLDNSFIGQHPDKWLNGFTKAHTNHYLTYTKEERRLIFIEQDAIDFFRNQISGNSTIQLPYFDEIYHLAAIMGGRTVLVEKNPIFVATNHVIDSLFFMWAVHNKEKIGRVLYVSTSVAYPKSKQDPRTHVPMKEEYLVLRGHGEIGLPESIYGWTKLAGEYLAVLAAEKYNLSTVCVRPFSGYGEDQDLSYPIPSIAARAARRENPLVVWGSGNQGRDFIHVDDFVSALRMAIQHVSDGSGINIGMGKLTTFKEVAQIMADIEGYSPTIKGLADKIEGSFAVYSDISKLKNLGWIPKYTLQQGFERVLKKIKGELSSI